MPKVSVRVGLTGGIGSGKSSIADFMRRRGAAIVDADAISRRLTGVNGAAMPAIVRAFGESVVTRDRALDRVRMRDLVFSDPSARQRLESIIHPLVGAETQRQADLAQLQGCPCIVFDIPLLVESGSRWRPLLDRVLVIDCGEETQIQRVMARSGLQRVEVERIIATQTDRKSRLSAADAVIFNDGIGLEGLADQLTVLAPSFGL